MLFRHYRLATRATLQFATAEADRTIGGSAALLLCSHPLQQHRLDASTAELLQGLQQGSPLEALTTGAGPEWTDYLERLRSQGCLRARYQLSPQANWAAMEVVIPVLDNAAGLARCLAALAKQAVPGDSTSGAALPYPAFRVTVVDDGSHPPLELPEEAAPLQCRLLRIPDNKGPASARNLGWRTPWPDGVVPFGVAFLDSDCVPGVDWLATGARLLQDPLVQAVGTRTDALDTAPVLGRYEAQCSSLHLGPRSGPVGGTWGIAPYLPSCNLLVRREALLAVDGFAEGLRFGEDVELCHRLMGAGHRLFYWAEAPVAHDHRTAWRAFMARRRAYGRTQSWLSAQAPLATGPARNEQWLLLPFQASLALWVLGSALHSVLWGILALLGGAVVLAGEGLFAARRHRLHQPVPLRVRGWAGLRRVGAGLLQAGRHTVRQTLIWWVPALVLWPQLLPGAFAVFALGAAGEALARQIRWRDLPLWAFLPGFAADALAYSLGRWEGSVLRALSTARDRILR